MFLIGSLAIAQYGDCGGTGCNGSSPIRSFTSLHFQQLTSSQLFILFHLIFVKPSLIA